MLLCTTPRYLKRLHGLFQFERRSCSIFRPDRSRLLVGAEYRGERYEDTPDSLNTTFNTIGSTDLEASRVNRDVWGFYQEVRIPVTSPTWNFPGAYSLEFDLAEREEWYSQNTAATSVVPFGALAVQHPETEVLGSLATD